MIWQKGIPDKRMYCWIRWFDKTWMDKPLAELAYFHPSHGLKFWSDEPDWPIDKMERTVFEYAEIIFPKEGE